MGWGVHDYPGPPPEREAPECPVCHSYCKEIIVDWWGNAIGCDVCTSSVDAYEWEDENKECRVG